MSATGYPESRESNEEFKTKIAIYALLALKALTKISSEYELHPNKISKWKKQLLILTT